MNDENRETLRKFAQKYGTPAFVQALDTSYAWQRSEAVAEHLGQAVAWALGLDEAATKLPPGYRQVLPAQLADDLDGYRAIQRVKALVEDADVPELPQVLLEEIALVRPAEPHEDGDEDGEVSAGRCVALQVTIGGVTAKLYLR